MASYARCLLFLIFAIFFFLQIHARDSNFFSKVTKATKKNDSSISFSPPLSPTSAPTLSPEPQLVQHGYGLYGPQNTPTKTLTPTQKEFSGQQEKYVPPQELSQTEEDSGGSYVPSYGATPYHPPRSEMLTKNTILGKDKYVPAQELGQTKNNYDGGNYQQGYGATPYYPPKSEGNQKYVPAQELGQTQNNYGGNYQQGYGATPYYPPKSEMVTKNTILGDDKYVQVEKSSKNNVNGNNYQYSPSSRNPVYGEHKHVSERQGMSDTRFLENGKYYYDVDQDSKDVNSFVDSQGNGYVPNKQGMSDTRFMENGKYFYDVQNQDVVKGNKQALSNDNNSENDQFQQEKNGMSDTRYLDNGKYFYNVNHENESRAGHNYEGNANSTNEHVTQKTEGNYGGTKKFPNEYDTMEEYDREQGYIDPQDVYIP